MRIIVLGCGSSGGVPLVTGFWGKCDPNNPKNKRRRSSILIQTEGKNILIDAGPDLREQLLDAKIRSIDAVIFTHSHSDHTRGLDELRHFFLETSKKIPIYGDKVTIDYLKNAYNYAFEQQDKNYPPFLEPYEFNEVFQLGTIQVKTLIQKHGASISWGIRIGNFAYSTDFNFICDKSLEHLQGLTCWIVDCLRIAPHPTHSHLDYTLSLIKKITPTQSILTHMNQDFDYNEAKNLLPTGICPAFDGMVIKIIKEKIVIYDKVN